MVEVDTSARLLRLLTLLGTRPTWSGSELSERLEVTTRTLRRDVTRLRELGYPVETATGRYGGYRLVPGGALPPLLLDDDEAVAVALGLRAAASGALAGFEDPAVAALTKIEQVLPARLRERLSMLGAATVWMAGRSPADIRIDPETLVAIARACRGNERLRFRYRDAAGNQSERYVEPLQLVHTGRRWYLVAWDRDREDWRSFRIDRIQGSVTTGMRFQPRPAPDAAAFVAEGIATGGYRYQARIVLELPMSRAARLVSPMVGVLEEVEDGTILRLGADDLDWIARYLASLPCPFRVIEPVELSEAVADLARALAASAFIAGGDKNHTEAGASPPPTI